MSDNYQTTVGSIISTTTATQINAPYMVGIAGGAGGAAYGAGGMSGLGYSNGYSNYNISDTKMSSDVVVDGVSLKDFMKSVNERLAILTPDLEKLEKYAALKAAYDHYKTIEALIGDDNMPKEE